MAPASVACVPLSAHSLRKRKRTGEPKYVSRNGSLALRLINEQEMEEKVDRKSQKRKKRK
jgi:hypothetical protein